MKKNIITFHGSPGTPEDFTTLEKTFGKEVSWQHINRYTQVCSNILTKDTKNYLLGYSFGSKRAIEEAVANPELYSGIILIAPFLYPDKKVSFFKKLFLEIPILGNFAVNKMAKSAIDKFLMVSSLPQAIPQSFKESAKYFSETKVLKKSVVEKDFDHNEMDQLLDRLTDTGMNILIIQGSHDLISPYNSIHFNKLKKKTLHHHFEMIQNGGHALLWTHAKELQLIMNKKMLDAQDIKFEKKEETQKRLGYYDGEHVFNNVSAFLNKHLTERADQPILKWVHPDTLKKWDYNLNTPLKHDQVTVKELAYVTATIAKGLQDLGIKKGDRVIIFIPMSLYLYAAMFAVQKIGAMAVFLDSWARRDQLGLSADVVSPSAMISVERAFDYMSDVPEIQKIPIKVVAGPITKEYSARLEDLMKGTELAVDEAVEQEHTALITFTTGSSGTPKGADRTHRFLAAQHYALNRHIPYQNGDCDLPVFPIFSLNNLAAGVTTIIPAIDVGTPNEKDALVLIAQMKAEGVNCTTLSPSLLNAVSAYCLKEGIKLPFLKRIVTGGAPVSKDDLKRITSVAQNAEVLVLYGSTEVEPMAHIEAKEMIKESTNTDAEWVEEGVNVGKMDDGLQMRFIHIEKGIVLVKEKSDWDKLVVPTGKVGELIVSGEHVCEGYYNNEEAFFRAKIRDENGVVWHRTGDLGRLDEDGNLWLVGRVHNAINRGGEYLFPVRAEIVLKKLPFVHLAAFLGLPDSVQGEKTACVITLREGHSKDKEEDYKKEIKRIMDKNRITVDEIYITDSIPMDPRHHSKVEYAVLREKILGSHA